MSKIILEKFCSQSLECLPLEYQNLNLADFGIEIKLYDYQQEALKNLLNCLYYYYSDKERYYEKYQINGLNDALQSRLNINRDDVNFSFLSNYYPVVDNNCIEFKHIINRASFWMATGSGKTLVMIKLIELIHELSKRIPEIPQNDILILAPKDNILNQIKEHIEIFNKFGNLYINFKDLREWENVKHQQINLFEENSITVFYYRADNITDQDKEKQIDYKTYLNNGKWYVILDEAHKGDSEFSKRQQYYTVLSQNGFLFNFSATFTDDIDIATTVYNFNLKRFIEAGYGKHIKITNQEFRHFNRRRDDEFTEVEKQKIVLKTLITLTAIKKEAESIKTIKSNTYHNPLLITIANSVNTIDADLKLFFKEIAIISKGDFDLEPAKSELLTDLQNHRGFQFDYDEEINSRTLATIKSITKNDILKYAFNANSFGSIEATRIAGNTRELAFKLTTSERHFCLLVASDALKWQLNVLEDYIVSDTPITESYFDEINLDNSDINILLGSRIFSEGWDSNRPNIINFINIGVNEEARKFVLQAMGRGVRIQPFNNFRTRIGDIHNRESFLTFDELTEIQKRSQAVESLYVFATNKEVVNNIINDLDKNISTDEWENVKGIKKSEITEDLLVPVYERSSEKNTKKYKISNEEYEKVIEYLNEIPEKVLIVENDINVRTINKIKNENNFKFYGTNINTNPLNIIYLLDGHFNRHLRILSRYKKISNEIKHFQHIQVKNLPAGEQ